jgi:hypothetical protein
MCLISTLHIIYRRQHLRLRRSIQPLAKHGVFAMFAATLEFWMGALAVSCSVWLRVRMW